MPSKFVSVCSRISGSWHTGAPDVDGGEVFATVVGASVVGATVVATVEPVGGIVGPDSVVLGSVALDAVVAVAVPAGAEVPPGTVEPGRVVAVADPVPEGVVAPGTVEPLALVAPGDVCGELWGENVTAEPSGDTTPISDPELLEPPDVPESAASSEPHAASSSTPVTTSSQVRDMDAG